MARSAATKTKTEPEAIPRVIQAIPLKDIVVSPFEPQARRRARFTSEDISELAHDIAETAKRTGGSGLYQPIKVRPVEIKGKPKFEIIYGELRFLAHAHNKAVTIDGQVEALDDEEAFRQQTSENDNRKEPHPMDQAANYEFHKKLLEEKRGMPVSVEELAEIVGKPVKHVAGRLKLNGLILDAQNDVEAGFMPLRHAMEMAKYSPEAQKLIYEVIYETGWDYETQKNIVDKTQPISFSELVDWIKRNILLRLVEAPFDKKATNLREDGLACIKCPQRTGANASLFDKGELGKNDSCLNPTCYEAKCGQLIENRRHEIAAEKEIDVTQVPLVATWNHANGEDYLGTQSFVQVGGKNGSDTWCEYQESAVNVKGSPHADGFGAIVQICRNSDCETHHPKQRGFSDSSGSSPAKGLSQEEKDEAGLIEKRKRREELFDLKVGQVVRYRVFKEAAENFAEQVAHEPVGTLEAEMDAMLLRFWSIAQFPVHNLTEQAAEAWEIDLTRSYGVKETDSTKIAALTIEQKAKLLFMFIHGHKGAMYGSNFVSQKEVKEIADKWNIDYQMLDAVERKNEAPNKHKQLFNDYIEKLEQGDKTVKVPRHITDKYKVRD